MKLGIIGLDSSHAVQFSRILNGEREPFHIGGHPVTAAYPGPVSQDFDMSRDPVSYTHLDVYKRQLMTWERPIISAAHLMRRRCCVV